MTETRDLDRKIRFRSMRCIWYLHTAILPHFPFTDHSFLLSPCAHIHGLSSIAHARLCCAFDMLAHRLFVTVVCFFFFIAIVSFFYYYYYVYSFFFYWSFFFSSLPKSKHKSHPIEFDSWYYFTFFFVFVSTIFFHSNSYCDFLAKIYRQLFHREYSFHSFEKREKKIVRSCSFYGQMFGESN